MWRRVDTAKLIWITIIIHYLIFMVGTTAANDDDYQDPIEEAPSFAWSSWSRWSPCSRTCGGGVAVQERRCLSRTNTSEEAAEDTSAIVVRVARQTSDGECFGEAKRYHECNTKPCLLASKENRAQQCASYDRRPFRGRFYTWVPYVDGNFPCTLNCRPMGQHFYASLALVADGTPCTKPGHRAICIQGVCKVVGLDGVLSNDVGRSGRCGSRLVSGLFARPRLPLGYSLVATVPRGACHLNVSEILPSENYIALKVSNGSYIMNGEFAVSTPGAYEAAGARFVYTRVAGQDIVYSQGPLLQPVDIMILYTQPNPSIKYAYFTDTIPGEINPTPAAKPDTPSIPKHSRRHHNLKPGSRSSNEETEDGPENVIGSRKFVWRVVSYGQCSRSCGGGIQLGKYRCVEVSDGGYREVSVVHCSGSAPGTRRRRCGIGSCPPRWRSAAWSVCPDCGPANRTRIVGCVQDHPRGITKVTDAKCPAPKPTAYEVCDVKDCVNTNQVDDNSMPDREMPREGTDAFHDGPIYTVTVNTSESDVGPEYSFSSAAGWLFTDWSKCVGWCVGGGVSTRVVRCGDPAGCAPRLPPDTEKTCSAIQHCDPHQGHWFTGEWSSCSAACGGRQVRGVLCIGGSGRRLRDSACKEPRPDALKSCGDDCQPAWYFSDWGQCSGACDNGSAVQSRTVWCAVNGAGGAPDHQCGPNKPTDTRPCKLTKCSTTTEMPIEPQRLPRNEFTNSDDTVKNEIDTEACEDMLSNCQLAVQARLCHYKYYIKNCCDSCRG